MKRLIEPVGRKDIFSSLCEHTLVNKWHECSKYDNFTCITRTSWHHGHYERDMKGGDEVLQHKTERNKEAGKDSQKE